MAGNKTIREREVAISLGIPEHRYDKGDIRLLRQGKRTKFEVVFSKAIYRMYCDGSISQGAYLKAKEIHDTVHEIEGSQIISTLDPHVMAAMAGDRSKKEPAGYHDNELDRAKLVFEWAALAGNMWPALLGVCVYGLTIEEAAKFVRKRKGFVSTSIKHTLEVMVR